MPMDILPFSIKMIVRILLAGLLSAPIGYERELIQRNAGLRTHILVAIGSALVMCTGEYMSIQYGASNADPARIGAQVVSGIGFLCAGTIIKDGLSVRGLTTATSLWCVCCIGLAVGAGNYIPAAVAVLLILIVLRILRTISLRQLQKHNRLTVRVELSSCSDSLMDLERHLERAGFRIIGMSFSSGGANNDRTAVLQIVLPKTMTSVSLLSSISEVAHISAATVIDE